MPFDVSRGTGHAAEAHDAAGRGDAVTMLGELLTASEADALAAQFVRGRHTVKALAEIAPTRRDTVKQLFAAAGLGHLDVERTIAVLHAVAGAKSAPRDLTPVWTMPGNEADTGHLTSQFHHLVSGARQSVTCATYNFQDTSAMWTALRGASETPGVAVTVYVDAATADTRAVKKQLPRATVYRSTETASGRPIVSHAKFVAIDHRMLLLTSANFSYSAENRNIELGLLIDDSALTASIEQTMRDKHGTLYELVR